LTSFVRVEDISRQELTYKAFAGINTEYDMMTMIDRLLDTGLIEYPLVVNTTMGYIFEIFAIGY